MKKAKKTTAKKAAPVVAAPTPKPEKIKEKCPKGVFKHVIIIEIMMLICIAILGYILFQVIVKNNNTKESDTTTTGQVIPEVEEKKELPVFRLSLSDVTLEEFQQGSKDTKYKRNTVEFKNEGNSITFEDVELKGRGNSTWEKPKPPFQLKFSKKVDFLGLGEAKNWVFLANYVDYSNLRNDTAFKLAEMLGEQYATRGEFVKVYVDNAYLGLYYLTHKMEAKTGSVELSNKYGVLMEIDNLHRETEDCIITKYNTCMTIKDTVADEDEEADIMNYAVNAFMKDYDKFEQAVRNKNYTQISEIADIRSLAEYYIISEFTSNPDAYDSSFYFYKDGLNDQIHAGPIWDYDYALSNRKWDPIANSIIYSPYSNNVQRNYLKNSNDTNEIYLLTDMPEFMEEVKRVYQEKLKGKKDELVNWVKTRAATIKDEALTDAERWNFEDVTYAMEYLIDWVSRRYDYFDYPYGE